MFFHHLLVYYNIIWLIFVSKGGKPLIGFIGLGNMGNHMARNLVSKGYPVLVYDVNTAAVDGLKQAGKYSSDNCSRPPYKYFLFSLGLSV